MKRHNENSSLITSIKQLFLLIPLQAYPHTILIVTSLLIAALLQFSVLSHLSQLLDLLGGESSQSSYSQTIHILARFLLLITLFTAIDVFNKYSIGRLSAFIGNIISLNLFSTYLKEPFAANHESRSDYIINICVRDVGLLIAAINSALTSSSDLFILSSISLYLLSVTPMLFFLVLSALLLFYFISIQVVRPLLSLSSKELDNSYRSLISLIRTSFLFLPYIKLRSELSFKIGQYHEIDLITWNASQLSKFLYTVPKPIAEFFAIISGVSVVTLLASKYSISDLLPTIGILAFALQRLAPSINSLYYSLSLITGYSASINNIYTSLISHSSGSSAICSVSILLSGDNVSALRSNSRQYELLKVNSLSYHNGSSALFSDVNLTINLNRPTCIIGPSGAGKTTLLFLLSGLLKPQSGSLSLLSSTHSITSTNTSHWFQSFNILVQNLYINYGPVYALFSRSFDDIDMNRLNKILNDLDLSDLIYSLPYKLQTDLTLHSRQLSGGQLQRLNLAALLYSPSQILLLDEPTSAVDLTLANSLFKLILNDPFYSDKSYIYITHQPSIASLASVTIDILDLLST
jgi:ATP-binding cassette subfamily B protein